MAEDLIFGFTDREALQIVSGTLPVPPNRVVYDTAHEILKPLLSNDAQNGGKGVQYAQRWLDESIAAGTTDSVAPGILARVIYWSGMTGLVAGYNREGTQVGFGHVQWDPDHKKREREMGYMSYFTYYVVGSDYTRQGIGFAMKRLLEDHVAINNIGLGAAFFTELGDEAPEYREAAKGLLQKMNAVPSPGAPEHYARVALKKSKVSGLKLKPNPFTRIIDDSKLPMTTRYKK